VKTVVSLKKQRRQIDGFTLVELTAAAALFALLTAAAFITYAQTWRHWALRQNAQKFYLTARYARVLAIESQRACQLVINPDSKTYYIVQEPEKIGQAVLRNEPVSLGTGQASMVSNLWHHPTKLDDAVSFDRVLTLQTVSTGLPGGITFRPDGSADAAMVQLGNGDRFYTVQISAATARVTLVAGAAEFFEPDQIDLDDM
jgi:prepilin-type N-terminal cleavage/methylation domain-containing protein